MRRPLYCLRRADGMLFALEDGGVDRIVAWAGLDEVARYRALNPELSVYVPTRLDESTAARLLGGVEALAAARFLEMPEENPDADLGRGRLVDWSGLDGGRP